MMVWINEIYRSKMVQLCHPLKVVAMPPLFPAGGAVAPDAG